MVAEPCYRCGKPAKYTCDASGCDHRMCQEHGVLKILESADPPADRDGEEHDHQHLCLDHAYLAQP
jgi:hypothetical protein